MEEGTPSKADIQQDLSTVYKTKRKQLLLQTISKSKNTKKNENPGLNLSTAPLHIWKSTMPRATTDQALGWYAVWAYQKTSKNYEETDNSKKEGEDHKNKKSKPPLQVLERERKNTSKADINHSRIRQMSPNWKKPRLPTNYLQIQNEEKKIASSESTYGRFAHLRSIAKDAGRGGESRNKPVPWPWGWYAGLRHQEVSSPLPDSACPGCCYLPLQPSWRGSKERSRWGARAGCRKAGQQAG